MKSTRNENGTYDVTVDDVVYLVYRSEGMWWAKNDYTVVDCAPTKAQLLRSLEVL